MGTFGAGRVVTVLVGVGLGGCFSYAHHERGPGPNFSTVPINKEPHADLRWSYVWGLFHDEWTPVDCTQVDAAGTCTRYSQRCPDGVGRVEVRFRPYSVPLMLVTLGMAVPLEVREFCSTQTAPGEGP